MTSNGATTMTVKAVAIINFFINPLLAKILKIMAF
jgi:hypothetical protein